MSSFKNICLKVAGPLNIVLQCIFYYFFMASTIASTLAVAAAVITPQRLAMAVPTVAATAVAVVPAAPTMPAIKATVAAKMNPPCTAFPCLLLRLCVILFRLVLIILFRLSRTIFNAGFSAISLNRDVYSSQFMYENILLYTM